MNDATLQIFYKDYFRKIYDFRTPLESFNFTKYNRSYDVFNFTNLIIKPKKVLDVGCGTGGLLSIFKEKGCEVLGLDFNDEYLSIAKINKINVKKGSLNILKKNDKFDLIILSHVLEHVLNPDLFLKETTNYLSTNGVIYIEVPSLNSILNGVYDYDLRNYLHNTHISNFSIESLKLLGKKTGLKMIKSNDLIQSCWIKSLNEDINDQDRNYTVKANQLLIKKIEQKRKNIITKIKIPFLKLRNILTKILEKLKIKNKIKYLFYSK
jgi:2-polyprenyl-3-methyl-5-hydroxy-6-metoxy-1,4-benzoquinol methylase